MVPRRAAIIIAGHVYRVTPRSVPRGDALSESPGRSIGSYWSGLGAGRIVGCHRVAQALGSHIGPVLLDVLDARGPALFAEHDTPTRRDLRECGPQGVLLFIVDQNEEAAVLVVEGVGAHFTSLDTGAVYGIAPGREAPSVVSTLARQPLLVGGYLTQG